MNRIASDVAIDWLVWIVFFGVFQRTADFRVFKSTGWFCSVSKDYFILCVSMELLVMGDSMD